MKIGLIDPGDRAGLALCRSLGTAGHKVVHLRFEPRLTAADVSRHCAGSIFIGDPSMNLEAASHKLADASRELDYLWPVSDKACELVYFALKRLHAGVVGPDPAAYRLAKNKFEAMRLASPWAKSPDTQLLDGLVITRSVRYPAFAKPIYSAEIRNDHLSIHSVTRVTTQQELERKLRDTLPTPVMLQAPIHGPGVGVNFAAFEGEVLGVSVTERLHEPHNGGGSSYRVTGTVTDELMEFACGVASELRWTGVMMIECKRQGEDLYFMEMNCRPWGSIGLSIYAGVDFPRLLIDRMESGNRQHMVIAKAGLYARHLRKDVAWALRRPRQWFEWGCSFRRILLGKETFDVERWTDPAPAAYQVVDQIMAVADKLSKRLPALADRVGLPVRSRILFVCKGNINRSYIAALVATKLGFHAASAGLMVRKGRMPSAEAEHFAELHELVSARPHTSKILEEEILPGDILVVFERRHLREVRARAPGHPVTLITHLAGEYGEIRDPHGKSSDEYMQCFHRISKLLRNAQAKTCD